MEKKNYDELFTDTDIHTGEDIFFTDDKLKNPYNGIVTDFFKGVLSWEFEVCDGFRTGIERKYYDSGELMEENQTDHNTTDGMAKEFYKSGRLKSIGIAIRNVFINSVFFDELGNVTEKYAMDENHSSYHSIKDKVSQYRERYEKDIAGFL